MDFLSGAPKFVTNRFNSINKYIWNTLVPEEVRKDKIGRKKTKAERTKEFQRLKGISQEAAIVSFIFFFRKFLLEGSEAAKRAVDTFDDLGQDGFYIGTNYFSKRNDKVMQGELLAERLLSSIDSRSLKELITESDYLYQILDKYREKI
jgi:hypothetical protein